jgi:hypothetical protein
MGGNMKAYIISVSMGYGSQRTAFSLRHLGEVINANDYDGIPEKDRRMWNQLKSGYELISRIKDIPIAGNIAFSLFDLFQRVPKFYPKRDLSKPSLALRLYSYMIRRGFGKDLISRLKEKPLPIISTFFVPAFMAEHFEYPEEIYCVICDTDISRTWAPLRPKSSKIKYFAPNQRVVERLKLYGVREENIFLTGYPLPVENIGSERMEILKEDMRNRLVNLDPRGKYMEKYGDLVFDKLGNLPERSDHPLTILFSVGGAGAQKEIGAAILKKLCPMIRRGEIRVILSAGIRRWVMEYFLNCIKKLKLEDLMGNYIDIIYEEIIEDYFERFNSALRKTDILWTKPSELSFYSALGIPIIASPPIGSHEESNLRWLVKSGYGVPQGDLRYIDQWLFDWLDNGYLAEMAMEGFVEVEKLGVFRIRDIVFGL